MKVILSTTAPSQIETECLVVPVLDTEEGKGNKPAPVVSDAAITTIASQFGAAELTGKLFETVLVYNPQGVKAKRVLFIGGGKAKNFTIVELRKVAGTAVRQMKPKQIKSFAICAPETWEGRADSNAHSTFVFERGDINDAIRSIAEGGIIADFDADYYRSDRKDQKLDTMTIVARNGSDTKAFERAIDEGRVIAESQNFARDLVNEPSNRMTPTIMAERAQKMAQEVGLKFEAYGPDKIKQLKMGAFWGVAQGSDEEPRLIVMTYEPQGGAAKNAPVLGLVGKGITFDTGGISIKPSDGMEKMKYDMAGGAAMIGAMRAIALLRPSMKVIGIVCATENMPSGKAQKPGDVQFAMNGKSIEIITTDAEGRLVLADGLCYARELGATHLIDAATLTGACMVALGSVNAGVFCNNEQYFEEFAQALKRSGEKMWRLPLDAEYNDLIKSEIADMKNTGGRWGGAITAALLLQEFVEDKPWLHLDIAGTAWVEDSKPFIAKGPSGIAVRSIVEFVRQMAAK